MVVASIPITFCSQSRNGKNLPEGGWQESINYNYVLDSLTEQWNGPVEEFPIKRVVVTEYSYNEVDLFDVLLVLLPFDLKSIFDRKLDQFIIQDQEKIFGFFTSLNANTYPRSRCTLQEPGKIYFVETYDPSTKMRGYFSLYFCQEGNQIKSIIILDEPFIILGQFYENSKLAGYLEKIGFKPKLGY